MASAEPGALRRAFLALWPEPLTRDRIVAARDTLALPGARALHPHDLHLTLAFLGDLSAARAACVAAAVEGIEAQAVQLTLTHCGGWPGPRVSWLAPDQVPAALHALLDRLYPALVPCGVAREVRPYRPHVTLHRKARDVPDTRLAAPIHWCADHLVLAATAESDGPVRYRQVRIWPLEQSPRRLG